MFQLAAILIFAAGVGGGPATPSIPVELKLNQGKSTGYSTVYKFGANDAVGTSAEDIWRAGGSYNWLTAADELRVASGGNAADDAAGAGCREVTVLGLDENWAEATEAIATAGASQSSLTTTTFIRVNRAYCSASGTYNVAANTGAITIQTEAGTTVAYIGAAEGQTLQTTYTVPAGKTAYLTWLQIDIEGTNTSTVEFKFRADADDTSAPVRSARVLYKIFDASGVINTTANVWPAIPEKTDLWLNATKVSGGGSTSAVTATYSMILVDN